MADLASSLNTKRYDVKTRAITRARLAINSDSLSLEVPTISGGRNAHGHLKHWLQVCSSQCTPAPALKRTAPLFFGGEHPRGIPHYCTISRTKKQLIDLKRAVTICLLAPLACRSTCDPVDVQFHNAQCWPSTDAASWSRRREKWCHSCIYPVGELATS